MMDAKKYPFNPEYFAKATKKLQKICSETEIFILCYVAAVLKDIDIRTLETWRLRGSNDKKLEKLISERTRASQDEVHKLFTIARKKADDYYKSVYVARGVKQTAEMIEAAESIKEEEKVSETFSTLGVTAETAQGKHFISVGSLLDFAAAWILTRIAAGNDQAVVTRELLDSLARNGLTTKALYDNGAGGDLAKAAASACVNRLSDYGARVADMAISDLHTNYVEVTAHRGARDKDGPNVWCNHERWQGRVYSIKDGDIYPSVYAVCGLDQVDGLRGVNCRHHYFPWFEGVSVRTYTEEDLAAMKWATPKQYGDKSYTYYEATQVLRRAENKHRKLQRQAAVAEADGETDKAERYKAKQRAVEEEYQRFAHTLGIDDEKRM